MLWLFKINYLKTTVKELILHKMISSNTAEAEGMLDKLVNYRVGQERSHIEKYSKEYVMGVIDDRDQIQLISHNINETDPKGVDIVDFVKLLLSVIPHKEDQTLYITAGIIDLFKEICETYSLQKLVKGIDVLNYIVEEFLNKNAQTDIVPTKLLPEKNSFKKTTKVRQIDLEAPIVYGHSDEKLKRLVRNKYYSDCYHHNNNSIRRGIYAHEIQRLFTLDSLGDHIGVYTVSCQLEMKIIPKQTGEKRETREIILLDFAWSNKQQRLGAALMDFSFSFWEANDNFDFEKNFSTLNLAADFQTNIWYIEFLDLWVSTDKSLAINTWDIAKETRLFQIVSPAIKAAIVEIEPIEVLKLVAISSMDKNVTIWDLEKQKCITSMDFSVGGIHSMIFFDTYQMFLTAGFENTVKIWNITPKYLDYSLVGKLIGHTTMITALEVIEKTPMVVSSDDSGGIKIWDIRNFACIQTVDLGKKATIHKMIYVSDFNKLAFLGSRVNFIEFEDIKLEKRNLGKEILYPVKIEYNTNTKEIVVCTSKEVRIYDLFSGRCKKIYTQFLSQEDEETPDITAFRLVQQNREFIIGNMKGAMGLYLYSTGELIRKLVGHSINITNLKVDYSNKIVVSSSMDGELFIQKENKKEDKFEVIRQVKNVHDGKEVSILEISVYHNLFVTGNFSQNCIYFYDYEYCKLIGYINLPDGAEPSYVAFVNGYGVILIGDSKGGIHFIHFKKKDVANIEFEYIAYIEIESMITRLIVDVDPAVGRANPGGRVFVSTINGYVKSFDIADIFKWKTVEFVEHANKKQSYNAERKSGDDFSYTLRHFKLTSFKIIPNGCPINLTSKKLLDFQAHKESLTTLVLMSSQEKRIIGASSDGYMRIWDLNGKAVGVININHPLPISWELSDEQLGKNRRKILYALKIVENVFKRYSSEALNFDKKQVGINNFLTKISSIPENNSKFKPRLGSMNDIYEKKLMKDEYDPRDLQFDKVKNMYQKELQGPTLKQMEHYKKIDLAAKQWASTKVTEYVEIEHYEKVIEDEREKHDFMNFLLSDVKNEIPDAKYPKKVREFGMQLEAHIKKLRKKEKEHRPLSKSMKNPFHLTSVPDNMSEKSENSESPRPKVDKMKKSTMAALHDKHDKHDSDERHDRHEKHEKHDKHEKHETKPHKPEKPEKSEKPQILKMHNSRSHLKLDEVKLNRPFSKVDFFDYASTKLSADYSLGSSLNSTKSTTIDLIKFPEKSKKSEFKNIMKKMDDNIKRSQKFKYSYSILKKTPEPSMKSMEGKVSLQITLPPIQSPSNIDKITEINRNFNGTPSDSYNMLPSYSLLHNYSANNLGHKSFLDELQKFKEDFMITNGLSSADFSDDDGEGETIPSRFIDETKPGGKEEKQKGGAFHRLDTLFSHHMGKVKTSNYKWDSEEQ